MPEVEHLPACAHFGLGVVPYSPLARGVLTAKYEPGQPPPEGTRAGVEDTRMITPGQFAMAWVLNNRLVTGVIGGPRTFEQWRDYFGGLDYAFTEEDEALVDSLVVTGHASTHGYNDPAYPIEGRIPR